MDTPAVKFPGGVTPLSAVTLAQTQDNFPCCAHFWPCEQSDIAAGKLVGKIGGVDLLCPSITAGADDYSVKPNLAGNGAKTGTFVPPAGSPFIYLTVGAFGAGPPSGEGSLTLGDKVFGPALRMSSGTQTILIGSDGGSYDGEFFTATDATIGRAIMITDYDSATGSQNLECYPGYNATFTNLGTGRTDQTNDPTVSPLVLDTLETATAAKWSSSGTVDGIYGAALFIFETAIPYDYVSAISWMTREWVLGNKSIWPGWKGVV